MNYKEICVNTIEDLNFQIKFNKNLQNEKFLNGIETINWNNKEQNIVEDFFVDSNDLKNYVDINYIPNTILCLKLYKFKDLELTNQTNQDIYDSIIELEDDVNNLFYQNLIDRTKKQSSLTKSCNSCKSIIKIEYINNHKCPVCNDEQFLFNDTDKQSYENKLNRLKKHKENFLDKKNKYIEKNIKKINKYLNNNLEEEYLNDFSFVWVLVSDGNKIVLDNDLILLPLMSNAYNNSIIKENDIENGFNISSEEIVDLQNDLENKIEQEIEKITEVED